MPDYIEGATFGMSSLDVPDIGDKTFYWDKNLKVWFSSFAASDDPKHISMLMAVIDHGDTFAPSGIMKGLAETKWKPSLGLCSEDVKIDIWIPQWLWEKKPSYLATLEKLRNIDLSYPDFTSWVKKGVFDPAVRREIPWDIFIQAEKLGLQIPGLTVKDVTGIGLGGDKMAEEEMVAKERIPHPVPLLDDLVQAKLQDSILYKPGVTMSQVEEARQREGGAEIGRAGSITPQPMMSLMDIPYYSLLAISEQFQEGEKGKYGRNNWKKGVCDPEYQRKRNANAIRHLMLWSNGDRSENHLAKVAWFCVTQLELERLERIQIDPNQLSLGI
jgi:hypothetical protein